MLVIFVGALLPLAGALLQVTGSVGPVDATPACVDPILARDYPRVAARVDLFEARANAPSPAIRRRVLTEVTYFAYGPNEDLVAYLRRLLDDPDPIVRGRAIHELYDYWLPVDPEDLPLVFAGYHDQRRVDRTDPELERRLLAELESPDPLAGYAAYEVGVLRLRSALPALSELTDRPNPFTRSAAARALFELGEKQRARSAFESLVEELCGAYRNGDTLPRETAPARHPWYAILACKGLAECGVEGRRRALAELVGLYGVLESSSDPNDAANLPLLRSTLHALTGVYAPTAAAAGEGLGH